MRTLLTEIRMANVATEEKTTSAIEDLSRSLQTAHDDAKNKIYQKYTLEELAFRAADEKGLEKELQDSRDVDDLFHEQVLHTLWRTSKKDYLKIELICNKALEIYDTVPVYKRLEPPEGEYLEHTVEHTKGTLLGFQETQEKHQKQTQFGNLLECAREVMAAKSCGFSLGRLFHEVKKDEEAKDDNYKVFFKAYHSEILRKTRSQRHSLNQKAKLIVSDLKSYISTDSISQQTIHNAIYHELRDLKEEELYTILLILKNSEEKKEMLEIFYTYSIYLILAKKQSNSEEAILSLFENNIYKKLESPFIKTKKAMEVIYSCDEDIEKVFNKLYDNNKKYLDNHPLPNMRDPDFNLLIDKRDSVEETQAILERNQGQNAYSKLMAIVEHSQKLSEYRSDPKYASLHRDPAWQRWLCHGLFLPLAPIRMIISKIKYGTVKFWHPEHRKIMTQQNRTAERLINHIKSMSAGG